MKILIIFLPGLGNAVLFEPTLRAIKNSFPDCKIHMLIKQNIVAELYSYSGLMDRFIIYPKVPVGKYDVVISTSASIGLKERIFLFFARANKNIKYYYDSAIHEVDNRLQLAKAIGADIMVDRNPRIYFPKNTKDFLPVSNQLTVGFHPGCSEALKYKRWPAYKFAKVADALNARIVLFGGIEEVALCRKVARIMDRKPLILAGKTNIFETAKAIGKCDLFVTNDSGLMHIASAMRVPTIAVFGATNEVKNAPLVKNHIILKNNNLNKILVKDVLRAIYELQKTIRKTIWRKKVKKQ